MFVPYRILGKSDAYLLPHVAHFRFSLLASLIAPFFENRFHVRVENACAFLAHWSNEFFYIFDKRFLKHLVLPFIRFVKFAKLVAAFEQGMYRVHILRAFSLRISNDAHHGSCYLILRPKERDGVAVALAHFLAVGSGNNSNALHNLLFRFLECFAVLLVEFRSDFARVLNMLFLVLPHRHDIGIVQNNVAGHEDWVIEKSDIRFKPARLLVFVRMRKFEESHRDERIEYPRQFRVLRHLGLLEYNEFFRVNAGSEIVAGYVQDVPAKLFRIFQRCEGVVISHHEVPSIVLLHVNQRLENPEIVPYMECSRRLEPGQKLLHMSLNIAENSANSML